MSKRIEEDLEFVLSADDIVIRYDREMDFIKIISALEDNELIHLLLSALRIVVQGDEELENFQA